MNNEKIVMTRKANAKMAHIQVQNGGRESASYVPFIYISHTKHTDYCACKLILIILM